LNEDQLAAKGVELAGQAEAGLGDAGVLVGELSGQIAKSATEQLKDAVKAVGELQYDITGAILGDLVEAGDDLAAMQRKIAGRVDGKAAELSAVSSGLRIPGPAITEDSAAVRNANPQAGENALDAPVPPNVSPDACGSGPPSTGTTPPSPHPTVEPSPSTGPPPGQPPGTATEPSSSSSGAGPTQTCPNCFTVCGPTASCPCGKITPVTGPTGATPPTPTTPPSTTPPAAEPPAAEPGAAPSYGTQPNLVSGAGLSLRCAVDAWVNMAYEITGQDGLVTPPITEMLGIVKDGDNYVFSGPQPDGFIAQQAYNTVAAGIGGVLGSAEKLMSSLVGLSGCDEPAYFQAMIQRVALGFMSQWISPELKELSQLHEYYTHALCPSLFPNVEQATQAFLGGTISPEVFESWIKINNHCPEPWEKVSQAIRTKLNPQELMALRLRKSIGESEYNAGMRQLGYLTQTDFDLAFSLSKQIPPVQELIRYMVRDVGDQALVDKFGMDDAFDNKWTGRIKEWGAMQGVDDEFAKATWRAHWIIPGPTQLFEMYHRLRTDADIENKRVDEATVKAALQQQDILPFWVDRLLAVSFRPLTRIDIRRAFDIGSIDRDEVLDANLQLGYSDENAETLTKFAEDQRNARIKSRPPVRQWMAEAINRDECTKRLVDDRYDEEAIEKALDDAEAGLRNSTPIKLYARFRIDRVEAMSQLEKLGVREKTIDKWLDSHLWNVDSHPAIKKYERGIISEEDLRTALFNYGAGAEKLQEILEESNHDIELDFNRDCIKAIETRFMLGEITDEETLQELRNINIANKFANQHLRAFRCKRSVQGKMPSTEKLCQWFTDGIIGPDEYFQRLQNIGWSAEDAANLHLQCSIRLGVKQQRAADKRAREEKAFADRQRRNQERLKKQFAKSRADKEKSVQKGLKTKERRDKAIIKAVEALVKKTGQDLPSAFSEVKSLIRGAELGFMIGRDDAIASVAKAIASPKYPEGESLQTLAFEFAESFAKLDASGVATNGKPF